jgi:hypothetical protein
MLGLEISTAGGQTHRIVFTGPVHLPVFLREAASATHTCVTRQGLDTLEDLVASMPNRT